MSGTRVVERRGIPDFGAVIERTRFVKAILNAHERLIVLCAPSGYGKTVLAAQVARSGHFDRVAWIGTFGHQLSPAGVLQAVARELGVVESSFGSASSSGEVDEQAVREEIRRMLVRGGEHGRLLVVLDDLRAPDSLVGLQSLGDMLSEVMGSPARVLVTSRCVDAADASRCDSMCVYETDDLRLSRGEAERVVGALGARRMASAVVSAILDACEGHAALLTVLARHPEAVYPSSGRGCSGSGPFDLSAYLVRVAKTQLTASQRRLLYVAALLGSGRTTDLDVAIGECDANELVFVSRCVPLVHVTRHAPPDVLWFDVHDLARAAILDGQDESFALGDDEVLSECVGVLTRRDELASALALVYRSRESTRVADWLEDNGPSLVARGHATMVLEALDRLGAATMVQRPRLLLLNAKSLEDRSRFEEALRKANVAIRLARYESDDTTLCEALLLAASLHMNAGDVPEALGCLEDALAIQSDEIPPDAKAEAHAAVAGVLNMTADFERSREYLDLAVKIAGTPGVRQRTQYRIRLVEASIRGMAGHMVDAVAPLTRLAMEEDAGCAHRSQALGNLAVALCETGRIRRSEEVLEQALEYCEVHEFVSSYHCYLAVRGANLAAEGSVDQAQTTMKESVEGCLASGELNSGYHNAIYQSTCLNAAGRHDEALSCAERALEYFAGAGNPLLENLASLEIAAALLALGDSSTAVRNAQAVHQWSRPRGARYHALRADLVLCEAWRREGRHAEAVDRLREDLDYILTESSNWQLAMYARTFPGLLAILGEAVGVERLPGHLVRLVLPETIVEAARISEGAAREVIQRLADRLPAKQRPELVEESPRTLPDSCRVSFFGGLEVATPDGPVTDRAWRKRKARLLFAMLAAERGKDVPRDRVLEYLWPEMEEAKARNNLYVVWNVMKHALVPNAERRAECPYVENVRGVCRAISSRVHTDLDDFDATLAEARDASSAGDVTSALRAYERLANLYRGDILPGDVYDDWFATLREQYRHEFSDAMLSAARLHASAGDPAAALRSLRKALAHDQWREDLYQAALAYQIETGQRSAAVETYVACRTRLGEDLGLDPSSETRRLYEQVLAMEEPTTPSA